MVEEESDATILFLAEVVAFDVCAEGGGETSQASIPSSQSIAMLLAKCDDDDDAVVVVASHNAIDGSDNNDGMLVLLWL